MNKGKEIKGRRRRINKTKVQKKAERHDKKNKKSRAAKNKKN